MATKCASCPIGSGKRCPQCNRKHAAEMRAKRSQDQRLKSDEYARGYHARTKDWRRGRSYGLENGEYVTRLSNQNGSCALCLGSQQTPAEVLGVDHDHSTGKVRDLLCRKCNTGLGAFGDDIDLFISAINYLRRHRV